MQSMPAGAAEWYRYENDYFVAYSDASERKSRRILRELEMFRAAASQVTNLSLGRNASKTQVLIFRKAGGIDELAGDRRVGSLTSNLGNSFVIATYVSGNNEWDAESIRHQFAHALLRQLPVPFPKWYDEGFAQLVSTIRFVDRGTAFTLGEPPILARYVPAPGIGWNRLVAEGWNRHDQTYKISRAAYVQAWLLTHYLMLSDDFAHTPGLHQYLREVADGTPSLEAFERAFGMDPDTLSRRHLGSYNRKLFALVFDFRPEDLHLDFERALADTRAVKQLIEQVKLAESEQ